MFSFLSTVGYATASINYTEDLSILLSGLIGLAWLSAMMIAVAALKESFSRPVKPELATTNEAVEHRLAV